MAYKIIFALFLLVFFVFPKPISGHEGHIHTDNSFVTIVNPQRISEYTKDYLTSFKAQLHEVEIRELSATWPVTYDVLTKKDFVEALKNMDDNQELGIFLEVTPDFAKAANVKYNESDSWHRANSLFTTGYTQKDRIKLIDIVFRKFKDEFGYYPTSVGAWYIDAYSLGYMQKTYGITSTINMSDQYDLDGYQLWGTPWSVPYYPSKINAAIPGDLKVLVLRWAARDPLNGYLKTTDREPSLFSLQDYGLFGLPYTYYESLLKTFALKSPHNAYGHVTVGLEGDLSLDLYQNMFSTQLNILKNLENQGLVQVMTMQDFAKWHNKNVSKVNIHVIESQDLTGKTNQRAFWIQTQYYRLGLMHNPEDSQTQILDLRIYPQDLEEPFYASPNKQFNLSINLPYVIDSVIEPDFSWSLDIGAVKNTGKDTLTFTKGSLRFTEKEIIFPEDTRFPNQIKNSPYVFVSGNVLQPNLNFPIKKEGQTYMDYSYDIPFTIKRRLPLFIADALPKVYFPIPQFHTISQTEMDALKVLKDLPEGKVLTYDRDCLDCSFQTKFKPASMAGKKGYVKKYSDKDIIEDLKFSTVKTSLEAKKELENKNVTYVYLSKYEDYIESLPYLPQDLGLSKVYENANAEIWKITSR